MKNKQGFTLMEILAVLLVIAVVASFAVPLVKSVRREMRYQKAKAAGIQLAEAVRSFYTDTKGCLASGSIHGADTANRSCPQTHSIKTGVPGSCGSSSAPVEYLFGCGYVSSKIFVDLSYTFNVASKESIKENDILVTGTEDVSSGETPRTFIVNRDMTVTEDD